MASAKDYSSFVPFDLYDFFGYLFPGILFAASMFLFMSQFNFQDVEPLKSTLTAFIDPPFIMSVAIVACGIVVLYVLGHFVATISHIIIDRVLIDGIEGYPINFLLNIPRVTRGYSESTYKYLFALYNLLLILPVIVGDYSTLHFLLKIVLGSIAFLILQRIVIMLVRTTKAGKARAHTLGDYWVFRIFLVPSKYLIDPLIGFFMRLLGLDRRFSDSFIAMYKDLFHQRFSPLLATALRGTPRLRFILGLH